uniref:IK cytokine n=1 Tax=Capra hircus TaxID=9925 RepID=A0A8C2QXK7_CAPHI
MWRGRRGLLRPSGCGVEELRCRRREREAALRKARREQQLVSKRLLRDEATEEAEGGRVVVILGEAQIQEFLRLAQRGIEEKERERALVSLRRGLQHPETQQTFISLVLGSTLPQHILQLLQPGPKLNLGVAVEFAWCLHYIICSQVNNALLITQGALTTLGLLLLDLAAAVQRTEDAGLELLVCPVVRCLSNLLTEAAAETVGGPMHLQDERVLAALFILLQFFLHKQPSLLPEGLWLLNNLTGEPFSNPLAPDGHDVDDPHSFHQSKLTNEDFRKLLMTPRAAPTSAPPSKSRHHEMPREYNEDEDPAARRRKKKSYYAKLRQQEIERERELAEKYRDRAKERRDGVNKDYEETELISTTANYRAVGPTAEADKSAAEKRRQLIQESKFLGGDMEHTHLVKGLDFALLQKVRAEIASKEKEEEEMMEKPQKETKKDEDPENKIEFKTRLGRNVYRMLFKSKAYERNELFLPGRMAYVVDLDDEYADTDIPTTLIRSKADCPTMEAQTTLTTNDIVISKLTQILSYLRQGTRNKKLKKKDKGKMEEKKPPEADMNIFEDIGDYVPSTTKTPRDKERERYRERERDRERDRDRDRERERERERDRDRERDREREEEKKRHSYFEKPKVDDEPMDVDKGPGSAKELIKSINEKFAGSAGWEGTESLKKPEDKKQLGDFFGMSNSYAECYPATMDDMAVDSDEEVDYSKMDQGNKKGPLGRWDFDTQEEYSEYMNNKEALPKAAFQYGIKMSEGRKTRRFKETNDKAELDRQWKKISAIIEKRKKMEADGVEVKRPKY